MSKIKLGNTYYTFKDESVIEVVAMSYTKDDPKESEYVYLKKPGTIDDLNFIVRPVVHLFESRKLAKAFIQKQLDEIREELKERITTIEELVAFCIDNDTQLNVITFGVKNETGMSEQTNIKRLVAIEKAEEFDLNIKPLLEKRNRQWKK